MKLSDFLGSSSTPDHAAWTKADVARSFQISPAAVSLWENVPKKYEKRMQQILDEGLLPPKVVKRVGTKDISDLELLKVMRSRSKISDWDLCQERGWRVWEFNQMLADLVRKYPIGDEFWRSV